MSNEPQQFRKVSIDPNKRGLRKKLSMVQSFAVALASRNINNKKINAPIKQLRVLSCFGNENDGGVLPPCEHLLESQSGKGKNICGACGCGDTSRTWLVAKSDEYSKLDYPKLACPLQMPGFTNYLVSSSDEADEPVTRKYYIENVPESALRDYDIVLNKISTKLNVNVYDFFNKYADLPIWFDLEHVSFNEKSSIYTDDTTKMILLEIEE